MRQFTNESQTAKLIELGFEKPKNSVECELPKGDWRIGQVGIRKAYSIGELIAMLPRTIKTYYDLNLLSSTQGWWVLYGIVGDGDMWSIEHEVYRNDLVDALYEMIIKLKEEGVI